MKDLKDLKKIAAYLQRFRPGHTIKTERVMMKGKNIPQGTKFLDPDGKEMPVKIDPKATYPMKRQIKVPVDHYEELKAAYKRGGKTAVDEYLKPFMQELREKLNQGQLESV